MHRQKRTFTFNCMNTTCPKVKNVFVFSTTRPTSRFGVIVSHGSSKFHVKRYSELIRLGIPHREALERARIYRLAVESEEIRRVMKDYGVNLDYDLLPID